MAQRTATRARTDSGIGRRRAAARDEGRAGYQERRAEIKAAAAALFKQEGYRGTSIGRIAQALGMDRATLYYYVSSKEEIFDEVVSEAVRANVALARKIRNAEGEAPDKLRILVTALMASYAENYPFLYVFIQENLSHVAPTRTDWSKEMRRLNKAYETAIVDIISDGIAEGSIRPIADAWVIAYGVIGLVSWTNRWFNPQSSTVDAATIGSAYAEMLLGGITVAKAPAKKAAPRASQAPAKKAAPRASQAPAKKAAKSTPAVTRTPAKKAAKKVAPGSTRR